MNTPSGLISINSRAPHKGRWSGGRLRRGLSLVEVMVAIAIFMTISIFVALIYRTGTNAFQKSQIHSDVYRMAMLAFENLRKELHGAKVVEVTASQVRYLVPMVENGHVKICDDGRISFELSEVLLSTVNEQGLIYLVRTSEGNSRHLACLGDRGAVSFSSQTDRLLVVEVRAEQDSPGAKQKESSYQLTARFYLSNQNN
jgi:hypothetical protein